MAKKTKRLSDKELDGREINPTVKVGDTITIAKALYDSNHHLVGSVEKVSRLHEDGSGNKYVATEKGTYVGGTCEMPEYVLANNHDKIAYLKLQHKEKNEKFQKQSDLYHKEMKSLEEQIEHLEKFPTEEDYAAYKLDKLLTAHKAGEPGALAEVLKELKSSNVL